jgi:hypothetical protein
MSERKKIWADLSVAEKAQKNWARLSADYRDDPATREAWKFGYLTGREMLRRVQGMSREQAEMARLREQRTLVISQGDIERPRVRLRDDSDPPEAA